MGPDLSLAFISIFSYRDLQVHLLTTGAVLQLAGWSNPFHFSILDLSLLNSAWNRPRLDFHFGFSASLLPVAAAS